MCIIFVVCVVFKCIFVNKVKSIKCFYFYFPGPRSGRRLRFRRAARSSEHRSAREDRVRRRLLASAEDFCVRNLRRLLVRGRHPSPAERRHAEEAAAADRRYHGHKSQIAQILRSPERIGNSNWKGLQRNLTLWPCFAESVCKAV